RHHKTNQHDTPNAHLAQKPHSQKDLRVPTSKHLQRPLFQSNNQLALRNLRSFLKQQTNLLNHQNLPSQTTLTPTHQNHQDHHLDHQCRHHHCLDQNLAQILDHQMDHRVQLHHVQQC